MEKFLKAMDDRKLFGKMQKGDVKSLEVLFDRYYNSLANFAFLFLKDEEASKGVISELFITLWEKRETIFIQDNLKSYLYKSVRNAVVSLKRKEKWTKVGFEEIEIGRIEAITPETLLLNKEFDEKIEKLLLDLPQKAGLVFRLKRIDGLKYKEIADILDISEKTVENHIGNAVKKIKTILEEHPELWEYFRK
jgi:RNA polymerase sigma-70 factor (ECF subfamily)